MAERAAQLVDHVLPDVPVRQWVLSLPHRVRYLVAWRHDLCRAVVRILMQAVERHLRTWARARGLQDVRGGGVAVIQRFGGSVNLNVHVHALVLDGVYARASDGRLRFHPAPEPTALDVEDIVTTIVAAVRRMLARHGVDLDGGDDAEDLLAAASPLLAGLAATSVQGRVGMPGDRDGRPRRLDQVPGVVHAGSEPLACAARWEGFDVHAGVRVPAGYRDRLERVCRYALRPAIAGERLHVNAAGEVVVQLRRPWADGTTHLAFPPSAFLGRLAVLVPRPHVNLLLYHGVLAPRAAWRAEVVPQAPPPTHDASTSPDDADAPSVGRGRRWADLMRRVFAVDVLACPCGGRLRLIAVIEASDATVRILRHLGLPDVVPPPRSSRAPPLDDWAA